MSGIAQPLALSRWHASGGRQIAYKCTACHVLLLNLFFGISLIIGRHITKQKSMEETENTGLVKPFPILSHLSFMESNKY